MKNYIAYLYLKNIYIIVTTFIIKNIIETTFIFFTECTHTHTHPLTLIYYNLKKANYKKRDYFIK